MTYEAVVDKINNIRRFGNLAGVTITDHMLKALGNPQDGMRLIHIAGTNGKGSVSAFLCEIPRASGLSVGVFTSPHLVDFRERICVDGQMIEKEAVSRLGSELLDRQFDVSPTMFDYCLVMAILYFKERQCDVVILETGLGGRLDSTNAVGTPEVSVIAKIGYDHMAILGETLEEIAAEKAGIIKKGTALVVESQEPGVLPIFLQEAKKVGTRVCRVIAPEQLRECHYENGEQSFAFERYGTLRMKMLGIHQYENAAAAIVAAEEFLGKDKLQMEWVKQGVYQTFWQGRMEIMRKEPFLMVDGAHNSNGVKALKLSLQSLFPGEKFHFIMGVMADKDYEQMVDELLELAIDFKTVTVDYDRALQAKELAECIRKRGVQAECVDDLQTCLMAEETDMGHKTIAFGSLYFIGEIEALLK